MKSSWMICCGAALWLTVSAHTANAKKEPLRVAYSGSIMPLHGEKRGKPVGFEIDLAKAIGKELKRPVVFVNAGTLGKDVVAAVASNDADISLNSLTATEARAKKVDFSKPYLVLPYILAAKSGKPFTSLQALEGKVAVPGGAAKADVQKAMPKADVVAVRTVKEAVVMVMRGRVDFLAANAVAAQLAIRDTSIKPLGSPFGESALVIAVQQGQAETYNTVLTKIEPKIKKLKDKWQPDQAFILKSPTALLDKLPKVWTELVSKKGKLYIPQYCATRTSRITLTKSDSGYRVEFDLGQESIDGKVDKVELVKKDTYQLSYQGQTVQLRYRKGSKTGQWGKATEFWGGKSRTYVADEFAGEYKTRQMELCAEEPAPQE